MWRIVLICELLFCSDMLKYDIKSGEVSSLTAGKFSCFFFPSNMFYLLM